MRAYTAVVERCTETGLYVGYVPGFAGAHSQGETLDELKSNLHEVIEMCPLLCPHARSGHRTVLARPSRLRPLRLCLPA